MQQHNLIVSSTRKMIPITGRTSSFQTFCFLKLQSQSKLYQNSIILFLFFLILSPGPSYHLLQSCFSVSMANLSRLVAVSFSGLALLSSSVSTANLSCMLATTFSSLSFLSNSFWIMSLQSFDSVHPLFLVVL